MTICGQDNQVRPRILAVDDDPGNLRVLGKLLQPAYEVLVAPSGERALEIAAAPLQPDLILLDVVMPGIDGYEVLTRLRDNAATRDIPVIFVTGMDSTEDEEKGLALGAVDYITKPYRRPIVLARVHTQLELKQARDRLRDQNASLEAEVARRVAENDLILACSAEGVCGVNAQGTITFINPAGAAMLGYEQGELLGRDMHTTIHGSRPDGTPYPAENCPLLTALAAGVTMRNMEEQLWRKDGTPLPVELSSMPMRKGDILLGAVVTFSDISERRRYLAQLERKSNYDDLTGLPNLNLLRDRLNQAIGRCRQDGKELTVLLLHLGRFKEINDTLGHDFGDRVLEEVSARLGEVAQEPDTVARGADNEFVYLVEGGEVAATVLAKTVLERLARPLAIRGRELFVSASIGIAIFPRDGDDSETLRRNAAAAMYKAEAAGGEVFRFYAPEMNARSLERLDVEADLRRALEREELVLHYQPQLSLRSSEIVGCEALLRWRHPRRGLLAPADFIPLAEETGLIVPIGEWVLRTACRQAQAWREAGLPTVTMAVNMSARQFATQDVAALVRMIVLETGLDPACLNLELTESVMMADADAFIDATAKLSQMQVTLSVDDFGIGFSSLSYLKRFALDRLKIDQSFVRDITHDPNSALIVQAIVALAHNLNLSVIAEGVETEAQLNFLRTRGCDEMQGYYFSQAVPAEEFEQLLRQRRTLILPSGVEVPAPTILIVDDEPHILASLKRLLRREGYRILTAESGAAGLEQMAASEVGVVISDARMPHMSGPEFLGKVRTMHPASIRIMLSGYTDLKAVTDAVNRGELFKFLTKPWNDDELLETVREAFRHYEARSRQTPALPAFGS